jgi:hypothetical protein
MGARIRELVDRVIEKIRAVVSPSQLVPVPVSSTPGRRRR